MENAINGSTVKDANGKIWGVYSSNDVWTKVICPDTLNEDILPTAELELVER